MQQNKAFHDLYCYEKTWNIMPADDKGETGEVVQTCKMTASQEGVGQVEVTATHDLWIDLTAQGKMMIQNGTGQFTITPLGP